LAGNIVVKFYGLLRRGLPEPRVEIPAGELSLAELLREAEKTSGKNFAPGLLDPGEKLLAGAIILVNGENIRRMQNLETRVRGGDTVELFSPAGGG
jgi:molybdopterin converting factor small subunit